MGLILKKKVFRGFITDECALKCGTKIIVIIFLGK